MEHVATHLVNMAVQRNPGCDAARHLLAPGIACTAANILVVNPQGYGRIRRAAEFMAVCRVRPGELSYGSAGAASPAHITAALCLRTTDLRAQHGRHRGGALATTDLVAGRASTDATLVACRGMVRPPALTRRPARRHRRGTHRREKKVANSREAPRRGVALMPAQALAGVRVLDLGTMITGPLAAMILADLGAEVVKVEPPEGDPFRSFAPDLYSAHFVAYNRCKRSIVLDLRDESGRARFAALLATADVLVENYRPGTLDRLGFPPTRIEAEFPRLVHCSISGFGTDGPAAGRPAYDGVAQAAAGTLSLFLDPEAPVVAGPTIADNIAGYTAALGVLGALVARGRTGRGGRVEVNMLEAMLAFTPDAFALVAMTGEAPGPLSRVAQSQTYVARCADGALLAIHLSAPPKFWTGLLAALEAPELGTDPRFAARPSRVANYVALRGELAARFARRDRAGWLDRLAAADVPHAPVLSIADVQREPQVRHLGSFGHFTHPDGRELAMVRPPWRFDGTRPPDGRRPPRLDEDGRAILAELGLREDETT